MSRGVMAIKGLSPWVLMRELMLDTYFVIPALV